MANVIFPLRLPPDVDKIVRRLAVEEGRTITQQLIYMIKAQIKNPVELTENETKESEHE